MDRAMPTSVESGTAKGELSPHDQRVIDTTLQAVAASNAARTEEVIARTRNVVSTEIDRAFKAYTTITMGRRIIMAVGAVAAFGLGFLVKGMITSSNDDGESEPNGVNE